MKAVARVGMVLLTAAIAFQAPVAAAPLEAAGPEWLRQPLTRGPFAASFTMDEDDGRWGVDAALPLRPGFARVAADLDGRPVLGLGLAIAGRGTSNAGGMRYAALLDRRGPSAGRWLGVSSGSDDDRSRLHVTAGLWRAIAAIEVESGLVSSVVEARRQEALHWGYAPDSTHWRDTTTFHEVDRSAVQLTTQSALRWRRGPIELTTLGGVIMGQGFIPKGWAQATLQVRTSGRLRFMAALGNRPSASLAFDPSARPRSMFGAQLALGPSTETESALRSRAVAWRVRSLGKDRVRLSVCSREASRVEVEGDFTEWSPVPLASTGSGWWETTLTIPPGLHQVRIRLDGREWQVPPGLPRAEGEFAGPAGMLLLD